MISIPVLFVELLLDAICIACGVFVLFKSESNTIKRLWGFFVVAMSVFLFFENSEWLAFAISKHSSISLYIPLPYELLSLWEIVKFATILQLFSIFPYISLNPGRVSTSQFCVFLMPTLVIICIAVCYQRFNGQYTTLHRFQEIAANINQIDVRVRLILFTAGVVVPTNNLVRTHFFPVQPMLRRRSNDMIIFSTSIAVLIAGYIWLMLSPIGFMFNTFGLVVALISIYTSVLFIRVDDPLSFPIDADALNSLDDSEQEVSPMVIRLSEKVEAFMRDDEPYTNPDYSIYNMIEDLVTNENRLSKALRYLGYSGFRDYLNYMRLQHFKRLVVSDVGLTIKELMYKSGFTSRSTFYRYFSSVEMISPTEYIEQLRQDIKNHDKYPADGENTPIDDPCVDEEKSV